MAADLFRTSSDGYQDELQLLDRTLILELIPSPAIIYNRNTDQVINTNERFLKLTGYAKSTLFSLTLDDLVPGKLDTNPTGNESRPVKLRVFSGDYTLADLRVLSISLTNQIVVLVFHPPKSEHELRNDLLQQELFFDNYSLLTTLNQQSSTAEVVSVVLDIVNRVVEGAKAGVYLPAKNDGLLHYQTTSSDSDLPLFPETLDKGWLDALPTLHVWKAGRKPLFKLHENALVQGYDYLLSIPLWFGDELKGIIAIAGQGQPPQDEVVRYLSLLASHTCSALHQTSLVESSRQALMNMRQVVQIEHAILDNLEEGVIILTPSLKIASMSPSAEIMLGYAVKEVFLQQADLVLIGNETLSTMYKSAQQGISTLVGNNLSLNTRNGKTFMAQVLCIPVMTDKVLTSIVLILRDLSQTEQIRARTQQLEQRAFLGEVSAIFAHEVKNPIHSLSVGLQYIGMNIEKDSPYLDLITRMQSDCQRLNHLMESTLTFSKPIEYRMNPVDLSSLIPAIFERWAPRMTRLNIHYNYDANPERPLVHGDVRALEQVFVNLVSNAIQAMENSGGGTLSVKVSPVHGAKDPELYEIIVADSGPGIPDDVIGHVFEPFMTTNQKGTGLGLAITKRIITAHQGTINVESYPGGTMFNIYLPKAD